MKQYILTDKKGNKFYFLDEEMKIGHRDDGPAIIFKNTGTKVWILHNEIIRIQPSK